MLVRFCGNLKSTEKRKGSLVSEEIKSAEYHIFKISQSCLSEESLKGLERSLKVKVDRNGLIVTVSRLEEAFSSDRILIPRDSHLATLLVLDAHEKVKHFETAATLAELRSRF